MAYISQFKYYTNNGVAPTDANFGSYQYVSLFDIVNNLTTNQGVYNEIVKAI